MRPRVKSWDLYDTLIAKRNGSETDTFRIAENASQVASDDIIVSDMWMSPERLRDISGFHNRMFVSDFGKGNGKIWPTVKAEYDIIEHTGDNVISDFNSPRNAGIPAKFYNGADATDIERTMQHRFPGLANVMREARLSTWDNDPLNRQRQLLQIEANFPLLFLASIKLHRMNIGKLGQHMLFSARDCYLWNQVMQTVQYIHKSPITALYFPTSRIAKLEAKASYVEYFKGTIPSAIIDIGGTGYSSAYLQQVAGTSVPQINLIKYPEKYAGYKPDFYVHPTIGLMPHKPGIQLERVNLAPGDMFVDDCNHINPANIDWHDWRITVGLRAFERATDLVEDQVYDMQTDIAATDSDIDTGLEMAYEEIRKRQDCMQFMAEPLVLEDKYVMQRIQK